MLLHSVIDHLVDDFVPALQQLGEDLDAIEERVFAGPKHEQLQDIFRMKRRPAAGARPPSASCSRA